MRRTQVYLGEDELDLLERASRETGASRSELIRRAVRATFGAKESSKRLRALQVSAGGWSARGPSGADYVDALRGAPGRRLSGLGWTSAKLE
jgi:Arc/MetJ-type ribon-helix-helix transcriptional regulator